MSGLRRIPAPVPLLDREPDVSLADSLDGAAASLMVDATATSVVVIDPHAAVREGLPLLLQPQGIVVVASAATGASGEELVVLHEPDVVLVALDLPDVDGMSLLRRLVQRGLRSAVVLYADAGGDDERAAAAMRAGAAGVIARHRTIGDLASALHVIAAGRVWFDEHVPDALPARPLAPAPSGGRTATLSSAELRVLALVADGGSTEETAEALSLSPHTVRTHLRNVMRKLEASSRAHAVAIAMRESAIKI